MAERGRLRDEAFRVDGFSGRKFRLFLNNLFGELAEPRYLEIGLFHGASFCPAIFKNRIRAVGIDNWSEYGGTSTKFYANLAQFNHDGADVKIVESDFRKVDYTTLGPFNVMFYDGSHHEKDQYDGVILPMPALDDRAILIVDDWNWHHVRRGTFAALKQSGRQVTYSVEVRTTFAGEHLPLVNGRGSEWHNGCYVAVIERG